MSARPDGLDPAEQEVLRIHQFGLDPDPLDLTNDPAYVLGYAHGWDDAPLRRPTWRPPLDRLLVSCVLAVVLLVGIAVGRASAAPRSAQATERFDVSPPSSAGPIGAPLGPVARSSSATGARVTPGPDGGAPLSLVLPR